LPIGGDLDIVWLFASFVVITLIPNIAGIIKSMIQGKPFGYGTAIGEAIVPIGMGGASYLSSTQQASAAAMARSGGTPGRLRQGYNATWNVIRGVSGGRIK
jgi:hypothetical protein